MSDVSALHVELTELRAQIAALLPAVPPQLPVVEPVQPAPVACTVKIFTLVGSPEFGYLHRDARTVRQLVGAVALALNAPVGSLDVPAEWVPLLRRVDAARASDVTWPVALAEASLELPANLSGHAAALRHELDTVWGQLRALVSATLDDLGDVTKEDLVTSLRRVIS